jgi:hypothetical protein
MNQKRINLGSLILDLLIDLGLIFMGAVLYYHFRIHPLGPIGLSDVFIRLVGSEFIAVLIIAGLPFIIGVLGLARTIFRAGKKLSAAPQKPGA